MRDATWFRVWFLLIPFCFVSCLDFLSLDSWNASAQGAFEVSFHRGEHSNKVPWDGVQEKTEAVPQFWHWFPTRKQKRHEHLGSPRFRLCSDSKARVWVRRFASCLVAAHLSFFCQTSICTSGRQESREQRSIFLMCLFSLCPPLRCPSSLPLSFLFLLPFPFFPSLLLSAFRHLSLHPPSHQKTVPLSKFTSEQPEPGSPLTVPKTHR